MPHLNAAGHRLEYAWFGTPSRGPVVVLLHEGLGSVAMWRDFPQALHAACAMPVFVYSRWGYGTSDPIPAAPRPIDYNTYEGCRVLPEVLAAARIERPILLGHSDGGSIALAYAAGSHGPRPRGVITMAAHVFVETVSTISIAKARVAYEESDLRMRLAKFHDDVDGAFYSWNTTWMLPAFIRGFNLEAEVERIACPITAIQGIEDEYGTPKQLEAIRARSGGRAEIVLIPECRHSPHRDQPAATLAAIGAHLARLTPG